jgi:hypothetical protein
VDYALIDRTFTPQVPLCAQIPHVRHRLNAMGLVWKRPRYVYHRRSEPRTKKGALVRRLGKLGKNVTLLFDAKR